MNGGGKDGLTVPVNDGENKLRDAFHCGQFIEVGGEGRGGGGFRSGRIPTLVLKGVWGGGDQRQRPLQCFMTAIYQPLHQNPAAREQISPIIC